LGAKLAASAFLGPAAGALVGKGAGYVIDRYGQPQFAPVQREDISVNPSLTVDGVSVPMTNMGAAANLGLPTVGNQWAGYTQGAGSLNNFGNTQFGTGIATQPGNWAPASSWGQGVVDRNPGSLRNFGNMSQGGGGATGGGQRGDGWSYGGATRGYSDTNRNFSLGGSPTGGFTNYNGLNRLKT